VNEFYNRNDDLDKLLPIVKDLVIWYIDLSGTRSLEYRFGLSSLWDFVMNEQLNIFFERL